MLAHAGDIEPSDLNRQLLMTHASVGTSRVDCATERLRQLNPRLDVVAVPENVCEENVAELVAQADLVVDCAPLFEERFLMNRAAVEQDTPLVECAMYELQAQITSVIPGETPCLACLYPERPPEWKREFPVFGAVSGTVGCLGAMEAIKIVSGIGDPLTGRLLTLDLRSMETKTMRIARRSDCDVCGSR